MLRKFVSLTVSLIIIISGLIFINYFLPSVSEYLGYDLHGNGMFGITFANIILWLPGLFVAFWLSLVLAPFITNIIFNYAEGMTTSLSKVPTSDILVMVFGIGIGLILANLIGGPFSHLPIVGPFIPIALSLVLAVVGAKLALRKHNDIVSFFNRIPNRRAIKPEEVEEDVLQGPLGDRLYSNNKLLDTSVIIDGRIMDIMAAGFVDGMLVVPNFVLEELQKLSDSADAIKRAKGRRGLDLVQDLQISYKEQVMVVDNDYADLEGVDAKLVRLAKQAKADIITNDYNLNKIAGIQGVKVLNINELANAIKPVVVAGEEMNVYLVKEGKEANQAVAYLDDGTMIVVENGRHAIGNSVPVIVTSVLQTAAGRMIFAKAK
ncbi:PIN/TRAM domain-containing protein [Phascolarctobacterium sp.]|uniref:PIN/TRAM domain-containing protein n=1 Tax=Phascolarctobacterium sp. TaxID=2049039 RepID=UPI003868B5C8